ncbi:DUF2877 domain-containing protein [Paraburkholderia sp. BCC1885]|uniref:DUF2877 domain-containing protein n=1 Tax=Paraburkholderia sp. BCC1885 TaxID=2562669 RepID=UPI0011825993|nr:DUF2877 domain-containing protein [Paraburkholderia sp. BCC1885]
MQIVSLTALSCGYHVPQGAAPTRRYRIHSRFRQALNLTRGDGDLLTLLDSRYGNTPAAIRVAAPLGWDWRSRTADGLAVLLQDGALHADGWRLALGRAVRWEPPPFTPRERPPPAALYKALTADLRRYVNEHGLHSALQLLPDWPTGGRVITLAVDDEPPRLQAQVERLIGYGTGLTPDGDDFLLGYLAVLRPWSHLDAIAGHFELLKQSITGQLKATTDISRHYLNMALQGHLSEPLSRLIAAISSSANDVEIHHAALSVMRTGSASGVDSLSGVIHGIAALQAALSVNIETL